MRRVLTLLIIAVVCGFVANPAYCFGAYGTAHFGGYGGGRIVRSFGPIYGGGYRGGYGRGYYSSTYDSPAARAAWLAQDNQHQASIRQQFEAQRQKNLADAQRELQQEERQAPGPDGFRINTDSSSIYVHNYSYNNTGNDSQTAQTPAALSPIAAGPHQSLARSL